MPGFSKPSPDLPQTTLAVPVNILTSRLFEDYLNCPTKCFLRAALEENEEETENIYATWAETRNESYRRDGLKRSASEFSPTTTRLAMCAAFFATLAIPLSACSSKMQNGFGLP